MAAPAVRQDTPPRTGGSGRLAVAFAAPLVGLALLTAVGTVGSADGGLADGTTTGIASDPAAEAAAYLEALRPIAEDGGRVVELGIKPGLTNVLDGDLDDALLADSAQGWQARMDQVRDALLAVRPPPELVDAHTTFHEALGHYLGVAVVLEEATHVPVDERTPFVDLAIDEGTRADEVWDRGAAAVQQHLRTVGLEPITWLPGDTEDGR